MIRRYEIRGFSTKTGNYWGTWTLEEFLDAPNRVDDLTDRKGKPLDPVREQKVRYQAQREEPDRILVRFVDDTGRTHHAWVYLSDYGQARWQDVNFDDVLESLEARYVVRVPAPEPTPEPKPIPEPKPVVRKVPVKRSILHRLSDEVKRIFTTTETGPSVNLLPKKRPQKRSVIDRLPARIRRLFRR